MILILGSSWDLASPEGGEDRLLDCHQKATEASGEANRQGGVGQYQSGESPVYVKDKKGTRISIITR